MPKRDVLDHMEKQQVAALRDRKACQILDESGAADALINVGIAQASELFRRVSTFAQYEALRQIDETKAWAWISRHGARPGGCRNIGEVCEVLGYPKDKYYLLKREVGTFSRHGAKMVESSGMTRRVRRALLDAPADVQTAALEVLGRNNGDRKAAAREVAELVSALIDTERGRADEAEADVKSRLAELGSAARDLKKTKHALERSEASLEQASEQVHKLKDKLSTLPYMTDKDFAELLESTRSALLANVGNFERAADSVAAKVAAGDASPETCEIVLALAELALNLWGRAFGSYLPQIDPGQKLTQFWAANALFSSPGARGDLERFAASAAAPSKARKGAAKK